MLQFKLKHYPMLLVRAEHLTRPAYARALLWLRGAARADNGTDRYGCCVSLLGVGVLSNLWSFLFKEPSSVLKGGDDNDNLSTARASCYGVRSQF